jgi:rhodanese-related sulfurtransferase
MIRMILAVLLLWSGGGLVACSQADSETGAVESQVLAARIASGDAPLILDVRTPAEFAKGHIPGAINIPHDELAGRVEELGVDRDAEVVVYCRSGRRAGVAESVLVESGFSNVHDLSGHWLGWSGAVSIP